GEVGSSPDQMPAVRHLLAANCTLLTAHRQPLLPTPNLRSTYHVFLDQTIPRDSRDCFGGLCPARARTASWGTAQQGCPQPGFRPPSGDVETADRHSPARAPKTPRKH